MSDNYKQILDVIHNYMEGTYTSDILLLKRLFHKDAHMTGYLGKELLIGTPDPFFEDMSRGLSMKAMGSPYTASVSLLSVSDRVATVILREDGFRGDVSLENHFQLIKERDKWLIISKNFTTL